MNPGKLIDAYAASTQNLRLGPDYKPGRRSRPTSQFRSEVGNGFARATEHCIGMGKCRAASGGTMCPSYRATREERYSTRGRARLLAEMLRGEVITDGWAERRGEGGARLVPRLQGLPQRLPDAHRHGGLQGRVPVALLRDDAAARARRGRWAASANGRRSPRSFPGLANAFLGSALQSAGRRCRRSERCRNSQRSTFRAQFKPERRQGERVVLFDDTFNNHFRPQTAARGAEAARGGGLRGRAAARARVLRPAVLRLRHARPAKRALELACSRRSSSRACRSWCSSRAACRCSATSCAALPGRRARARGCRCCQLSANFCCRRSFTAKSRQAECSCTRTATRRRCGAAKADLELLQGRRLRGHRARHRLLRHVGLVRLQAASTTRPRSASPASRCCRRSRRRPTPRWWRAASPAASRSRPSPAGRRCTSPSCSPDDRRARASRRWCFVALVCLLAGFAHGALGFGFPLVATPLVALVIDMKSAIALLAPVTLVLVLISALRGGSLARAGAALLVPAARHRRSAPGSARGCCSPRRPSRSCWCWRVVILLYLNLDRLGRGRERDGAAAARAVRLRRSASSPACSRRSPTSPARSCSSTSCCSALAPAQMVQTLNLCFTRGQGLAGGDAGPPPGALTPATWAGGGGAHRALGGGAVRRHARARAASMPRPTGAGCAGRSGSWRVLLVLQFSHSVFASRAAVRRRSTSTSERAALELVERRQTDAQRAQCRTATRALHRAVETGMRRLAQSLLAAGADPQARTAERRDRAAPRGAPSGAASSPTCCSPRGADPRAHNADGESPLHWAALSGHIVVAQRLLARGARRAPQDRQRLQPRATTRAARGHVRRSRRLLERADQ